MNAFAGAAEPLSREVFKEVVDDLRVGVPELLAVLAVESRNCGFLPDRRPIILFERHVFHKRTQGRFSSQHPDISNQEPGGYAGLAKEYVRLEKAAALDRRAALESASWGAGQIMGFNHIVAGFATVEAMVTAMQQSEDAHLGSVAGFIKAKNLVPALQSKDWPVFAKGYNGLAYAKNQYDKRLLGAHAQFAVGVLPDIQVRRAQMYLTYLGFAPGAVDGIYGKRSRSSVTQFKQVRGLPLDDEVDDATLQRLQDDVRAMLA